MIFSIMGLLKIFKFIILLPIAYDAERIMKTFIYYNFHGIGFYAFYPPYYIQYFREDEFFIEVEPTVIGFPSGPIKLKFRLML